MNLEELDVVLGGRSILNPREYNSLALAHIGDAVFEVLVRLTVLTDGNAPVNKLHKKARAIVNAKAQAEMYYRIQDILTEEDGYSADMEVKLHQTIKKVSSDFENLKYNTAIAAMMALINEFYKKNSVTKGEYRTLLTLLNPVAPHITEELWQRAGFDGRVYQTVWPEFDEEKTKEATVEIAVQINGKTRATLAIQKDDQKDTVIENAKKVIADKLTGSIVKEIYVPGRIVRDYRMMLYQSAVPFFARRIRSAPAWKESYPFWTAHPVWRASLAQRR